MNRKEATIIKWLIILIAIGIIEVSSQNIILNGDFKTNACSGTETLDQDGCQIDNAADNWISSFIYQGLPAPTAVLTIDDYNGFPGDATTRVVPLAYKYNDKYRISCVTQSISTTLNKGVYKLQYDIATRNNLNDQDQIYSYFSVQIFGGSPVKYALQNANYRLYAQGHLSMNYQFVSYQQTSSQVFAICGKAGLYSDWDSNQVAYVLNVPNAGVSNIKLTYLQSVDIQSEKPLHTDLIKNGDFKTNNCVSSGITVTSQFRSCAMNGAVPFWQGSFNTDYSNAPYSIQKTDSYKTFGDATTRIIPLISYEMDRFSDPGNYSMNSICIRQKLGSLRNGLYTLTFDSTTRLQTDTQYLPDYDFKVWISDENFNSYAMSQRNLIFDSYEHKQRSFTWTLGGKKVDQYIYFCNTNVINGYNDFHNLQHAAAISNVVLKNAGCPAGTHIEKLIVGGPAGDEMGCFLKAYQDIWSCDTYMPATGEDLYQCKNCTKATVLINADYNTKEYQKCIKRAIRDCVLYDISDTCIKCIGQQAFNTVYRACPSVLRIKIPHCLKTHVIQSNTVACLLCEKDYFLNLEFTGCRKRVQNCRDYDNRTDTCKKCVQNYTLYKNLCYKTFGDCTYYDTTLNKCIKCNDNFDLKNGSCISNLPCKEDEYRNRDSICVKGIGKNCKEYNISTGICQHCKDGYYFNEKFECVLKLVCPQNTSEYVYVVEFGVCKKIPSNCAYMLPTGCAACIEGYYLENTICRTVQSIKQRSNSLR